MASNTSGVYPIDPSTPVGFMRSELGDIVASNIVQPDPNVPGTADYEYISDAYLTALQINYTNPLEALARAAISMGNQMIAAAQNIQVSDIKINTIQRAQLMIDSANVALAGALAGDANAAFTIVGLNNRPRSGYVEGQRLPWPGFPFEGGRAIGESGF